MHYIKLVFGHLTTKLLIFQLGKERALLKTSAIFEVNFQLLPEQLYFLGVDTALLPSPLQVEVSWNIRQKIPSMIPSMILYLNAEFFQSMARSKDFELLTIVIKIFRIHHEGNRNFVGFKKLLSKCVDQNVLCCLILMHKWLLLLDSSLLAMIDAFDLILQ